MHIRPLLFILVLLAAAAPAGASQVANGEVVGEVTTYTVKKNESLSSIAQKFSMSIVELQAANPGVDPWKPKPGTQIVVGNMHVVPGITRDGIVINLETSRLFYFTGGNEVMTFPVAQGKQGWETPVAATKVYAKRKDPTWTPPPRIREENPDLPEFIPPGPNNPLGKYALSLGLNGIMIHGTNAPSSVGKRVSHGCMRMYAADIERLFHAVKVGTPVLLMKKPYEFGWHGRTLYLQMAPRLKKMKPEEAKYKPDIELYSAIQGQAGPNAVIDWGAVEQAVLRADGIPVAVAQRPISDFVGPVQPEEKAARAQERPAQPRRASLYIIQHQASNP